MTLPCLLQEGMPAAGSGTIVYNAGFSLGSGGVEIIRGRRADLSKPAPVPQLRNAALTGHLMQQPKPSTPPVPCLSPTRVIDISQLSADSDFKPLSSQHPNIVVSSRKLSGKGKASPVPPAAVATGVSFLSNTWGTQPTKVTSPPPSLPAPRVSSPPPPALPSPPTRDRELQWDSNLVNAVNLSSLSSGTPKKVDEPAWRRPATLPSEMLSVKAKNTRSQPKQRLSPGPASPQRRNGRLSPDVSTVPPPASIAPPSAPTVAVPSAVHTSRQLLAPQLQSQPQPQPQPQQQQSRQPNWEGVASELQGEVGYLKKQVSNLMDTVSLVANREIRVQLELDTLKASICDMNHAREQDKVREKTTVSVGIDPPTPASPRRTLPTPAYDGLFLPQGTAPPTPVMPPVPFSPQVVPVLPSPDHNATLRDDRQSVHSILTQSEVFPSSHVRQPIWQSTPTATASQESTLQPIRRSVPSLASSRSDAPSQPHDVPQPAQQRSGSSASAQFVQHLSQDAPRQGSVHFYQRNHSQGPGDVQSMPSMDLRSVASAQPTPQGMAPVPFVRSTLPEAPKPQSRQGSVLSARSEALHEAREVLSCDSAPSVRSMPSEPNVQGNRQPSVHSVQDMRQGSVQSDTRRMERKGSVPVHSVQLMKQEPVRRASTPQSSVRLVSADRQPSVQSVRSERTPATAVPSPQDEETEVEIDVQSLGAGSPVSTAAPAKKVQIVIEDLDGNAVAFTMDDSSTINRVKKSIKEVWAYEVPAQRLIFKGAALHDNSTLAECGVVDGCILHFLGDTPPVPRRHSSTPYMRSDSSSSAPPAVGGNMWQLTIQDLVGNMLALPVPQPCSVKDLKMHIQTAWKHPVATQRLIFRGRLLIDEKQLEDEDIANHDTVHLLAGLPGRQPSTSGNSGASGGSVLSQATPVDRF